MKNLLQKEWRLILFGFVMTFWSAPGQTFFIALFSGELRRELGLGHGDFGLLYSLATLLSAVVIIWSGALIDRVDLRRFSLTIIVGLALGCAAFSISHSTLALVISLFLLRHFGQGLMFLSASTTVVRYLQADHGKANAISSMGYSLSEAVMPKLLVITIALVGWRLTWQAAATVLLFVVAPATIYLMKNHHQRHRRFLDELYEQTSVPSPATRRQWQRSQVLRDPRFYLFLPSLMAQTILFTGFIFHQVHLVDSKGWELSDWTAYFALYAGVAITMKFASGYLVDRFSATGLLPLHTLPLGIAMFLLAGSDEAWVAPVFLMLLALTSGMQATLTTPFLAEQYGNRHLGAIKSMLSAVSVFMSALSPFAMGWMIDHGITLSQQARVAAVYTLIAIAMAGVGYLLSPRSSRPG
ncbi:MAG: MFS transporter [Gammaproteobacteria bacterium]|nr:MFS transporter [Gammaproteobacteria bacterium]